ncbi:universal stress protein [Botrimarina mediterranea]|uniref:Universal stress protein family protein n=1 Tax=Botrimarina mediterranea TaxID=2528022 RepID=A0A518KAG2_9BACT|nr:universal stress protein [Botrimarina mediterranea]QDV74783.1 Universal stress protein family protein [Botrimarina mediterranea]QDV79427.1 Universal stress protein family protein [Planctomycetes bacterium K2D]
MNRSILVGLGGMGTEGACYTEAATQTAIELARRNEALLTGVTIVNTAQLGSLGPAPIGAGAMAAEMREHRFAETRDRVAAAVVAFENACTAAGLRYKVLREERSEPFDYLISQARYHDLTLIGLRGLFEYGVAGEAHYNAADTMVKLIAGGVRPLIATGPKYRPINRVMIAYSGSPQSAKTMRRFVQMRLWPDATVRVVAFGDDYERRQRHLSHAAGYFEAHDIDVELDYQPGDARKGLLEAAHEWNADLIVMGNSHRTLISRKVLGDTVLETIHHSDLPLFLSQ